MHSHVYCSIIHDCQDMKPRCLSTDGWMKKKTDVAYLHNKLFPSQDKGGYPAIFFFLATWMDREHIMLNATSQKRQSSAEYPSDVKSKREWVGWRNSI